MMFMQFFIWGSWSVTLGLVMTQHNMSLLIGDAFSAGPIASILSPFVLGMLVDRFFPSQKVMAVMNLAGAVILWFVPGALVAENGALLIGLLFGYTLCFMPTLALSNNIAFHSLASSDKSFPVVRVFGTIGWIVAGIFIGVTGIASSTAIFTLAAICSVALAIYSLTLPHTPAPAKGMPLKVRDLFCADAFALLKIRHFFVFALCATLISIPLGTYYAYTASWLADAGVSNVSTAMSFGQMSEIVFMLVIPLLFHRLGVKYMLLVGMVAWFVRYALFAMGMNDESRALIYMGILLHGVCYDFFFVVGFIYTDRIAGEKVKGQAQSMVVMFTYGIGMLLGSQISGALYNRLIAGQGTAQNWATFWWIPAIAAAVIAVLFLFTFKYRDEAV
jgi:nucleoside transporter